MVFKKSVRAAVISLGLQIISVALIPNLILKSFYNPDDPWGSFILAYFFLIATAIAFPVVSFLVLRSANREGKQSNHRHNIIICRTILGLSLALSILIIFWNQIRFLLQQF